MIPIKGFLYRLAMVEKEAGAAYPAFLVTFEDGSSRIMRAYELLFYAINRRLYLNGGSGGIFNGDPLPELAFVDYTLASGDPSLISQFIANEIEVMKGR